MPLDNSFVHSPGAFDGEVRALFFRFHLPDEKDAVSTLRQGPVRSTSNNVILAGWRTYSVPRYAPVQEPTTHKPPFPGECRNRNPIGDLSILDMGIHRTHHLCWLCGAVCKLSYDISTVSSHLGDMWHLRARTYSVKLWSLHGTGLDTVRCIEILLFLAV